MPETIPTSEARFELEWSVLQAACSAHANQQNSAHKNRLGGLLHTSLNWNFLLQLAERHGVAPILYQTLASLENENASGVPPATLLPLKQHYETNLHRTMFLARELLRVLDSFDTASIDVLPYKGIALAETLYGDIALRQAGDIDLLIRPRDLSRIKDTLRNLGYTPHQQFSEREERAYLRFGYECAFDSKLGRNLLEVQWALQPRFYAVLFEMESLFRRSVPINVAGRNMKTPLPEDLFLILCLHAAKHVWGRLIWLCDIAQILKLPALDWQWIGETARSLGIVRILQVTLLLTKQLLGTPIPVAAEQVFSLDQSAVALRMMNEIATQIRSGVSSDVESLSYFRLMMRLRERRADRIRFLQRLTFTPGPGEWNSVRLPAPLFPLYRVVRLWRLAARFAGAPPLAKAKL